MTHKRQNKHRQNKQIKKATKELFYTKTNDTSYYYDINLKDKISTAPIFLYIKKKCNTIKRLSRKKVEWYTKANYKKAPPILWNDKHSQIRKILSHKIKE